ncbi:MAG TPA: hypothetical protein VFD60_00815 [Nitrososphaeraceae archaeon]|nr:hypothetical protein [Nitrososphaeraceae archaeon]
MTLQIKPWLKYATLIALGILLIASIRGCHQGQASVAAAEKWHRSTDSLNNVTKILKVIIDSTKKSYQDSLDFVNGQLALAKNQLIATKYLLDSADSRITALRGRYRPIQPNADTSITTVPNDYIANCADCFTELSNGQAKVKQYMGQIDDLNKSYQSKINLQQNRINQLDQQNAQLSGTLQDCLEVSKAAEKKLAPHGQLFFSWSVLWVPYIPTMAGVGLMYQNKYKLQIGVRGMFGRYGNGFETEVNMPLSLKRK